ncbi:hypothetical protein EDB81DRAFT_933757 [Dactylonectria macrodidyma]|uniref:Uncharacterized protein n=1 Tax=Dactylonectria macrodidyma TaxID=307937 RepID=A0A9P9EVH4_9HYPO|nr:hypothetical protein EDB81DRAFT_933757 [Dactylonectria macrodidyma]
MWGDPKKTKVMHFSKSKLKTMPAVRHGDAEKHPEVGAISYFAMASGLAWSVIPTHLRRSDAVAYQIFFAKYIFWVVAFPVIIIALGLVSGVNWATIFFNIFLVWIWIISYLCSAYTATRYNRSSADRDHTMLAGWVNFFWFLYLIAFAVSDGGNVIGVTQSLIFFGILDLLLVAGTAFAFLFLARKWDYSRMNLHFTQYGRVSSHGNDLHPETRHIGPTGTTPATTASATHSRVVNPV